MCRKAEVLILLFPMFCSFLIALKGRDDRPYTQWTGNEVTLILTDSPWARQKIASPHGDVYQFDLLTARPVREAFLRAISLKPEKSADITELETTGAVNIDKGLIVSIPANPDGSPGQDREQRRLMDFVKSNPDNILVKGDEENVVVSFNLRIQGDRSWAWMFTGDNHGTKSVAIDPSELKTVTRLETDTGKSVTLLRFEPSGMDVLGAKFFFKRQLADGSPLVTTKDKELRFTTHLDGHRIEVRFDLRQMIYKGKLEF